MLCSLWKLPGLRIESMSSAFSRWILIPCTTSEIPNHPFLTVSAFCPIWLKWSWGAKWTEVSQVRLLSIFYKKGRKKRREAGKKEGLQNKVRANRPQRDFPGGSDSKESACNVRNPSMNPGNPLQYSYLENPMDRQAWKAAVHGVTKSRTRLSDYH